jgi:hypothetical protein
MNLFIRLLLVIALDSLAGLDQAMCQGSVSIVVGPPPVQINPPIVLPPGYFGAPRTRMGSSYRAGSSYGAPLVPSGFEHLEELKKQDPRYTEQIFPDILKTTYDIEIRDLRWGTEAYLSSKYEYQQLLDQCVGLQSAQKITDELVKSSVGTLESVYSNLDTVDKKAQIDKGKRIDAALKSAEHFTDGVVREELENTTKALSNWNNRLESRMAACCLKQDSLVSSRTSSPLTIAKPNGHDGLSNGTQVPVPSVSSVGAAQSLSEHLTTIDKIEDQIRRANPRDSRLLFIDTQRSILKGLSESSYFSAHPADAEWLSRVAHRFMTSFELAMGGNIARQGRTPEESQSEWNFVFEKKKAGFWWKPALDEAQQVQKGQKSFAATGPQAPERVAVIFTKAHIEWDLPMALLFEGVGTDEAYDEVGRIVQNAWNDHSRFPHTFIQIGESMDPMLKNIDPMEMRKAVRENAKELLKKAGFHDPRHGGRIEVKRTEARNGLDAQ